MRDFDKIDRSERLDLLYRGKKLGLSAKEVKDRFNKYYNSVMFYGERNRGHRIFKEAYERYKSQKGNKEKNLVFDLYEFCMNTKRPCNS